MSHWINIFGLYLLIGLLLWVAGNGLSALLARIIRPSPCTRRERHRLWLLASLPITVPATVIVPMLLLSFAKLTGLSADHCLQHEQHHPHFCFIHFPQLFAQAHQPVILLITTSLAITWIGYRLSLYFEHKTKTKTLQRLASGRGCVKTVASPEPVAFTLGVRAPEIYLSSGLKTVLSSKQQRIVLAHEIAHLRHGDLLKNSVFETLLSFHVRQSNLRERWQLYMETSADDRVARRYDRLDIAETLIKLQRFKQTGLTGISFTGASTHARLCRLMDPPETTRNLPLEWIMAFSLLMAPVFLFDNHHALETILGWWLVL